MQDQKDEINLLEYWNVIWYRKILVISLTFIVVTVTMVLSLRSPNFYKSDTMIMASGSESGGLGAALSSLPFAGVLGGSGGQTSADKIMIILRSRTIAEKVINKFDLVKVINRSEWDESKGVWKNPGKPPLLEDTIKALTGIAKFTKSKEGTITISVEWKDPVLAANIANYYVDALTGFLNEKAINVTIQVVDKAVPTAHRSRPKIRQNMMLAGITSMFIGVFIAFFLEYLAKQKTTNKL